MIALAKPVRRKPVQPYKHYKVPIVITLLPGDYIELRLSRQRTTVAISINHLFDELLHRKARTARTRKSR
jgi:hypothetical protein